MWGGVGGGITPVLRGARRNLGATSAFYHIFSRASRNSVCAYRAAQIGSHNPLARPENYKVALTPCILCNREL